MIRLMVVAFAAFALGAAILLPIMMVAGNWWAAAASAVTLALSLAVLNALIVESRGGEPVWRENRVTIALSFLMLGVVAVVGIQRLVSGDVASAILSFVALLFASRWVVGKLQRHENE
jgi:hypothetical protein